MSCWYHYITKVKIRLIVALAVHAAQNLPPEVAPSNEEQNLIVHAAQNLSQEVDPQASVPVEDECWPYTWSVTPGIISPLENIIEAAPST